MMLGNKCDAGAELDDMNLSQAGTDASIVENRARHKRKLLAAKYCVSLLANETLSGRAAYEVMQALIEKVCDFLITDY
jgi:hypothetical protein